MQLEVNLIGWRGFIRHKVDPSFQATARRVWERDQYICQYCSFQATQYQDVVNIDGNYANNDLKNLITACCFCSQCLFLQAVGIDDTSGGQLIYLPDLSQADLNGLCHVLFCAMSSSSEYQDSAQQLYQTLKFRSQAVENVFGSGMSKPMMMGRVMLEHRARFPKKRKNVLRDVRLLPSYARFKDQLAAWSEDALEELGEEEEME